MSFFNQLNQVAQKMENSIFSAFLPQIETFIAPVIRETEQKLLKSIAGATPPAFLKQMEQELLQVLPSPLGTQITEIADRMWLAAIHSASVLVSEASGATTPTTPARQVDPATALNSDTHA